MLNRYSDFDYGTRVKDAGLKIVISTKVNCWHLGGATFKTLTPEDNKLSHDKDYIIYLDKYKDHPVLGERIRQILESSPRL